MTLLKRFAAGAAVAALMAGSAACSKDDPVGAPTTTPPTTTTEPSPTVTASATPSPSPSPSATPTPTLSQRAQAEADAIAMVKKYYALSDKLASKPPTVTETKRQLSAVATSETLAYRISTIGQYHQEKQIQTGSTAIVKASVESVDLTWSPKTNPPREPDIQFKVCRDVSDLELFDAEGNSLSNPKRQMRRVSHVTVTNIAWPSRSGWRVRDVSDESASC